MLRVALNFEELMRECFGPLQALIEDVTGMDGAFAGAVEEIKNLTRVMLTDDSGALAADALNDAEEDLLNFLMRSQLQRDQLADVVNSAWQAEAEAEFDADMAQGEAVSVRQALENLRTFLDVRLPQPVQIMAEPMSSPGTTVNGKIITQCSNCQGKLKLDAEKIGKKVKCPKCQAVFVVEELRNLPQSKPEIIPLKAQPRPLQPKDFFETQHTRFIPEKAKSVDVHISYNIEGENGGEWTLIIKNGECTIRPGGDPNARTFVKMSTKTYLELMKGKLDGRVAFMLGKLKIKGDKASVAIMRECFRNPEI